MSKPSLETFRATTTAIAVLAAVAGVVLLFAIPNPPYVYALLHIGGCLAVAALAWRWPWLAILASVIGTVVLAVYSLRHELVFPLGGSSAEAQYEAWASAHDPFDTAVALATAALVLVGLVALIARLVRASRTASAGPEELVAPR